MYGTNAEEWPYVPRDFSSRENVAMIVDYRERVNKSKNVNKKHRRVMKLPAVLMLALVAFISGVITGWSIFATPAHDSATSVTAAVSEDGEAVQEPIAVTEEKQKDPRLTFYDALPKGASPVIGSGINQPKKVPSGVAPAHAQVAEVKISNLKREKGRFTVQAASCQSRRDAETVKSRLVSAGLQPFILESTVGEKGTWYRVRLGKGLDAASAASLAAKAGNGAMVIEE